MYLYSGTYNSDSCKKYVSCATIYIYIYIYIYTYTHDPNRRTSQLAGKVRQLGYKKLQEGRALVLALDS